MRRRLYFLLPNLDSARRAHDELLLARIEERHIHYLTPSEMEAADLPRANLFQRSDLVHGLQMGLIYGGLAGMLAGGLSMPLLGLGLQAGGVLVLVTALAGALFGAWAASMIGVSVPNHRLRQFEDAIARGQILLMVDVPKGRADEIAELIRRLHPEADAHGVEPTIPAFP